MREGNTQGTLGYLQLPAGATATRPVGNAGMMRYNTDTSQFEFFSNTWANAATLSSIANTYLPLAGGILTGTVLHPDGNATAPSISFSSNPNAGVFYTSAPGANSITMTIATTNSFVVQSNVAAPSFVFNSVDGVMLPSGSTTDRPPAVRAGVMRWNTTLAGWDLFDGSGWDTHRYVNLTGGDSVVSEAMDFVYDTTRVKYLSTSHMTIMYQSLAMGTDDYLYPGGMNFSTDVGSVMPYPGTVVGLTVYTSNVNKSIRNFSVYVDTVENANLLSFGSTTATTAQSGVSTNENIDFNAGQKLSVRSHFGSGTTGNKWSNVNIILYYKWRN